MTNATPTLNIIPTLRIKTLDTIRAKIKPLDCRFTLD